LLGQLAPLGTGEFQLLLNEESLEEHRAETRVYGAIERSMQLGAMTPGAMTPYVGGEKTPWYAMPSPGPLEASFSPQIEGGLGGAFTPMAAYAPKSPGYALQSPGYRFVLSIIEFCLTML
jgi:DNA-directed RNA polymerase II subunit RPB1